MPIFRVKSVKNLHRPEKFTLTASAASATIISYGDDYKKSIKVQPGEVWHNRREDRGVEADQGVARHGQVSHLKMKAAENYLKNQLNSV